MRLISIQEELEQSNVTREELLNQINDTVYSIKSFKIPVTNGTIVISVSRKKLLEEGRIEIGVAYYPTEPECNENMFKEPMEFFIKELFNILEPTLKNADPTILSGIKINYFGYSVYYKEGILNFITRDYLTHLDKVNIMADIDLFDAYTNLDNALSDHVIPMDRLPRFGEGYSLAMDKSIKRIKTTYRAYQKGKYKGFPYELHPNPTVTVHQQSDSWDSHSRVILPMFHLSISVGIKEYEGDQSELRSALIKRFEHFGIQFN